MSPVFNPIQSDTTRETLSSGSATGDLTEEADLEMRQVRIKSLYDKAATDRRMYSRPWPQPQPQPEL